MKKRENTKRYVTSRRVLKTQFSRDPLERSPGVEGVRFPEVGLRRGSEETDSDGCLISKGQHNTQKHEEGLNLRICPKEITVTRKKI